MPLAAPLCDPRSWWDLSLPLADAKGSLMVGIPHSSTCNLAIPLGTPLVVPTYPRSPFCRDFERGGSWLLLCTGTCALSGKSKVFPLLKSTSFGID